MSGSQLHWCLRSSFDPENSLASWPSRPETHRTPPGESSLAFIGAAQHHSHAWSHAGGQVSLGTERRGGMPWQHRRKKPLKWVGVNCPQGYQSGSILLYAAWFRPYYSGWALNSLWPPLSKATYGHFHSQLSSYSAPKRLLSSYPNQTLKFNPYTHRLRVYHAFSLKLMKYYRLKQHQNTAGQRLNPKSQK